MKNIGENMRRNNRRKTDPNDIFGLSELLDSWLDMMQLMPMVDQITQVQARPKHQGTMSYEDREKDIVFTIDMPGVEKKDIDITVEEHSITVKSESNGRKYNYSRKFRPVVDVNSANATFKNGVLDIVIKKIEAKETGKQVKIK
jgi:HSP20 family molecular chaperone IbpA